MPMKLRIIDTHQGGIDENQSGRPRWGAWICFRLASFYTPLIPTTTLGCSSRFGRTVRAALNGWESAVWSRRGPVPFKLSANSNPARRTAEIGRRRGIRWRRLGRSRNTHWPRSSVCQSLSPKSETSATGETAGTSSCSTGEHRLAGLSVLQASVLWTSRPDYCDGIFCKSSRRCSRRADYRDFCSA